MALPVGELGSKEIIQGLDVQLAQEAADFHDATGMMPGLALLTDYYSGHVGTQRYMANKSAVGERLGFRVHTEVLDMPDHTTSGDPWPMSSTDSLVASIERLNFDETIHGIVAQLPLADRRAEKTVLAKIHPHKDVDGLGPVKGPNPATPLAIDSLLAGHGVDVREEDVVVFGLGPLVGLPYLELVRSSGNEHAKGFDEFSDPLERASALNTASVIVTAMGQGAIVTPDMFDDMSRPRVLIDAGTAEADGAGDVTPELRELALENGWALNSRIGSVGPLTIRMLLKNTLVAAREQAAGARPVAASL